MFLKPLWPAAVLLMTYGVTSKAGAAQLEYARNSATLGDPTVSIQGSDDEEKQANMDRSLTPGDKAEATPDQGRAEKALIENKSVFTWKDLTYTVKTSDGDRVLLDHVNGFIKPGTLKALMGLSGAGKVSVIAY